MSQDPAVLSSPATTGRYLVLLRKEADPKIQGDSLRQLQNLTHLQVLDRNQKEPGMHELPDNCALVFDHIGVALLRCSPSAGEALGRRATEPGSAIMAIEPERSIYATTAQATPEPQRSTQTTTGKGASHWGVLAVGADLSACSGKGIRVAILDTGLDLEHPDFAGRAVTAGSFIEGESAQDGNGHGTHCAGIAAGPLVPATENRYGVAWNAELFIGKVLSDQGAGADGSVLAGIDWAIQNGCHIVSLSLGSPVLPGQAYSRVFEAVAQRALAAGTLLIAAAGNESHRPEHIAPVGHPANCPSILAVGALDETLQVAPFSSGGLEGDGGEINLAAPGVDILSSWQRPEQYRKISGTSMATPFVAGVAALHAEADLAARASTLGERLANTARSLEAPAQDVGAGLVQSPRSDATTLSDRNEQPHDTSALDRSGT